jgi:hypothetical protein
LDKVSSYNPALDLHVFPLCLDKELVQSKEHQGFLLENHYGRSELDIPKQIQNILVVYDDANQGNT